MEMENVLNIRKSFLNFDFKFCVYNNNNNENNLIKNGESYTIMNCLKKYQDIPKIRPSVSQVFCNVFNELCFQFIMQQCGVNRKKSPSSFRDCLKKK